MADIFPPAAQPGLAAPPGPSSQSILDALSNMAPRDPAAANPATAAAMARSRDAITRILEKQLSRQEAPFSRLADVASAAEVTLRSGGNTPFGKTLEEMDQTRAQKTSQIANALGQQAQREANVGGKAISPYQSAQLMMQTLKFQASRGDKDAQLAEQAIDNIRSSLEPSDAVGFVIDAHAALQAAQRQKGAPLSGQESAAIVTQQARSGGYKPRQVGVNMITDAFGNIIRTDNRQGTATYVQPGVPAVGGGASIPSARAPVADVLGRLPPPGTPQPGEFSGPSLAQNAPGAAERARSQGPRTMTQAQEGAIEQERVKGQLALDSFKQIVEATKRDVAQGGALSMGPAGWLARIGGAAIENARAMFTSPDPEKRLEAAEFRDLLNRKQGMLDGVVKAGAQSAGIKAGILSIAYTYAKAMDSAGQVNVKELDYALALLGEQSGSPEQFNSAVQVLERNVVSRRNPGAAPAAGAPQAGKVEVGQDGMAYQFQGGDPADPKSWKLLK